MQAHGLQLEPFLHIADHGGQVLAQEGQPGWVNRDFLPHDFVFVEGDVINGTSTSTIWRNYWVIYIHTLYSVT